MIALLLLAAAEVRPAEGEVAYVLLPATGEASWSVAARWDGGAEERIRPRSHWPSAHFWWEREGERLELAAEEGGDSARAWPGRSPARRRRRATERRW